MAKIKYDIHCPLTGELMSTFEIEGERKPVGQRCPHPPLDIPSLPGEELGDYYIRSVSERNRIEHSAIIVRTDPKS